ncbi:hypothetical protein LX36DRAFT_754627, partial [Colletotrichum falcatum]
PQQFYPILTASSPPSAPSRSHHPIVSPPPYLPAAGHGYLAGPPAIPCVCQRPGRQSQECARDGKCRGKGQGRGGD